MKLTPELKAQILINFPQAHKPIEENSLIEFLEALLARVEALESAMNPDVLNPESVSQQL